MWKEVGCRRGGVCEEKKRKETIFLVSKQGLQSSVQPKDTFRSYWKGIRRTGLFGRIAFMPSKLKCYLPQKKDRAVIHRYDFYLQYCQCLRLTIASEP